MPKYKISAVQTVKDTIYNYVEADSPEEALKKAKNSSEFIETAIPLNAYQYSSIEEVNDYKVEEEIKKRV